MNTGLHQYVLDRLQAWKGRWPLVARGAGISLRTLEKIARQEVKDPSVSSVECLARFFVQAEKPVRRSRPS